MIRLTRRTFRAWSLCGAGAAALLTAAPALAQEQEPATRSDVIIITAQKRAEDIIDVGATVSAMGAKALEERRIGQVSDFVSELANVDVKENSPGVLPVITIRGIGLNDFSATNNPAAGVYVDEVYLSSLALLNADFFDLERVEALRGPQGTLVRPQLDCRRHQYHLGPAGPVRVLGSGRRGIRQLRDRRS